MQNIFALFLDYAINHVRSGMVSLGQLRRTPIASLMILGVIGVVFALPAGFFVVLDNIDKLVVNLDKGAQLSLFLTQDVTDAQAVNISAAIAKRPEVDSTHFISRSQALQEFQQLAGFADVLHELPTNPLPHLVVVSLKDDVSVAKIKRLQQSLARMGEIDYAQLDLEWIKRLFALMSLAQRAVWFLAVILGFGVFVIVGNTIRMAIYHRRDEIEIISLVGGANGFIRRPFLYLGFWFGAGGGLLACLIVALSVAWLSKPLATLASLYQQPVFWHGLSWQHSMLLIMVSGILGITGAWLSVSRHLRDMGS